ncbi:hypothetical protein GCM10009654_47490 [Streptomyces hebeiensis]|uniref:Uncharacterized protein n=1 Tax=Streptomyces hebeiensis TaxID=229486 RepID=A0ABN1UZY4_9ACTN
MNHGHDGTERVFAALPPARGRAFARTWWGRAWLCYQVARLLDEDPFVLRGRAARIPRPSWRNGRDRRDRRDRRSNER